MMISNPQTPVIRTLSQGIQSIPVGGVVVGYSGGLDSTVLLHALSRLPDMGERKLRALHVNHQLHPQSSQWTLHCIETCDAWRVPIEVIKVKVEKNTSEGIEAAARHARYEAFSDVMQSGEIVTLAHHQDDQNETVFLKLLRGAGPESLAAMRFLRPFKKGYLWRPLLALPRSALRAYAESCDLTWIDDPTNTDTRLDRNFLRREIFPRLRTRWTALDKSLNQVTSRQRAVWDFIQNEAEKALEKIGNKHEHTLSWRLWLTLPEALRDPVLRLWLRTLHLPPPTHFSVEELERQLTAPNDCRLNIRWKGVELRRYRDRLYAMTPLIPVSKEWGKHWKGNLLILPGDRGGIEIRYFNHLEKNNFSELSEQNEAENSAIDFHVRFRRGGENFKPARSLHTRELRILFQEAGIPPWQRDRIPLIYAANTLIAVGDLWLSSAGEELLTRRGYRLCWDKKKTDNSYPQESGN